MLEPPPLSNSTSSLPPRQLFWSMIMNLKVGEDFVREMEENPDGSKTYRTKRALCFD